MPEYTLHCKPCDQEFERFAWNELEEHKLICPNCAKAEGVTVLWSIGLAGEDIHNIGCGCGL